jgi:hypothetical protein
MSYSRPYKRVIWPEVTRPEGVGQKWLYTIPNGILGGDNLFSAQFHGLSHWIQMQNFIFSYKELCRRLQYLYTYITHYTDYMNILRSSYSVDIGKIRTWMMRPWTKRLFGKWTKRPCLVRDFSYTLIYSKCVLTKILFSTFRYRTV